MCKVRCNVKDSWLGEMTTHTFLNVINMSHSLLNINYNFFHDPYYDMVSEFSAPCAREGDCDWNTKEDIVGNLLRNLVHTSQWFVRKLGTHQSKGNISSVKI